MGRYDHALRVLEFHTVIERLVASCETPLGAKHASVLEPQFEADAVWALVTETDEAYRLLGRSNPPSLSAVGDWGLAVDRASKGATLGGVELHGIGLSLQAMRAFRGFFAEAEGKSRLDSLAARMPSIPKLDHRLVEDLDGSGGLMDSASAALATIRRKKRELAGNITERIQSYTTGKTRDLLSDPIYTVRDGRYVIPLKAEYRGKIRGIVHDTSASGQTVYLEPEDVLQLGNRLREMDAAERQEEQRILEELSKAVGANRDAIVEGIEATGEADLLLAKARLAYAMKGSAPVPSQGYGIYIERGRHPLMDAERAVPLDLTVGFQNRGLLITGPNTGGKTVSIKTVGLFVAMAQAGLFVPAALVRLGPFSQLWADIGDEQSLQQSLSTFSGHLKNIAEALKWLQPGALVMLDEIGAGTDPAEGAALGKAILQSLADGGAVILASTHYGELKAFGYETPGFANAAMEFDRKSLKPTYKLLMGSPGGSHALQIAARYGIPKQVLDQADAWMGAESKQLGSMMAKLEDAQKQARLAQGEADRRTAEIRHMEKQLEKSLREAEETRKSLKTKLRAEMEAEIREVRLQAADLFDELRRSGGGTKPIEEARRKLKALESSALHDEAPMTPALASPVIKGASVRVTGTAQVGIVAEVVGGQATVQMGPMKLKMPVERLEVVGAKKEVKAAKQNLGLARAQTMPTELHLRALRAEDAELELQQFIDDAVLAGLDQVRIVHGKGEGVLRQLTRDFLRRCKSVAAFREGEPGEGGAGVTIASLK